MTDKQNSDASGSTTGTGSSAATESGSTATSSTATATGTSPDDEGTTSGTDTLVTARVDLERDDDTDMRRLMLNDYSRCLTKHDATLTDLLRMHERETAATQKLNLKVTQAAKKEADTTKQAKRLNKKADRILRGMRDIVDPGTTRHDSIAEALRHAVEDIRRKIDENRRKNDEMDHKIEDLRAKIEQRRANNRLEKNRTDLIKQEEPKNDAVCVLRTINQSLNLVNRRLNTDYHVDECADSPTEVRGTLDKVLNDVVNLSCDFRKLNDDIIEVKRKIYEQEMKINEAKRKNEELDVESKKMVAVCDPKEADSVDPADYDRIRKIIDNAFQENIEKLKQQTKEILQLVDAKTKAENVEQAHKAELDKQLAVIQAKIDAAKDAISKLTVQNEFLRNQLQKGTSLPSSVYASDLLNKIKSLNLGTGSGLSSEQMAAIYCQDDVMADPSRRELNELSAAINDADEKILRKRRELQEANERIEMERDMFQRNILSLQQQIAAIERAIDAIEKELAGLKDPASADESNSLKQELERLNNLARDKQAKVQQLKEQAATLENEGGRAHDELKDQLKQVNALKARMLSEDVRRRALEEKLANVKQKTNELDRKLETQREKTYIIERPVNSRQTPTDSAFTMNRRSASQPATIGRSSANYPHSGTDARILDLENNRNQSRNQRNVLRAKLGSGGSGASYE